MKHLKNLIAAAAMLAGACSLSAAPVLVAHSGLQGASLSGSDLEAVLLGKSVSVNGARVVLVLAKASDNQEAFLKSSIGKTDAQFKNHWRRLFMTGGGSAPKEVDNEAAVASEVASTPGAIGIVDEASAAGLPVIAR